jgi:hypothetical protein
LTAGGLCETPAVNGSAPNLLLLLLLVVLVVELLHAREQTHRRSMRLPHAVRVPICATGVRPAETTEYDANNSK